MGNFPDSDFHQQGCFFVVFIWEFGRKYDNFKQHSKSLLKLECRVVVCHNFVYTNRGILTPILNVHQIGLY